MDRVCERGERERERERLVENRGIEMYQIAKDRDLPLLPNFHLLLHPTRRHRCAVREFEGKEGT